MGLQFYFGGSGAGKSRQLHQHITTWAKKEPERNFLFLVPDQFTMQTQRELVARQERHSIMNVDVVSFNRLAYRILDELGMSHLNILEETGKNLVLRRVAEEQQNNLRLMKVIQKNTLA